MNYIIEYEICAIACVIIIFISFLRSHFFPSIQNRLFGTLLAFTIADLTLDVITAITIEKVLSLPFWLNYLLNTMFYSMQMIFPVIALFYVISLAGKLWSMSLKKILLAVTAGAVSLIALIFVNPFTGILFYIDPVQGYLYGPFFKALHVISSSYLLIIIIYLIRHKKAIQHNQLVSAVWFVSLVITAIIVQLIYPNLLILGTVIGIAVSVMYFMLQNPRDMVDYRTKTLNYNAFILCLNELIMEKAQLYLISVDLYNMPYINRIFGINSSNMLLSSIAQFLKDDSKRVWVFRTTDTRFVVITLDEKEHESVKERINERFNQPWNIDSSQIIPSFAVCSITKQEVLDFGLDNLASTMDIALSNAVRNKEKNPLSIINECDINEFTYLLEVEASLHEALFEKDGLCMYFQPIYSLEDKKFIGLEALVRFNHPKFGLLLPSEFLHIAEKNGLMQKLDQIVVKKVCDFINEYEPYERLKMQFICINLSAAEFASNVMPKKLTEYIKNNIAQPEKIFFEITETIAASSKENLLECMNQYISMGFKFALDDFGTGYANIAQAIELPFALIKIDQSLLTASPSVLNDILHMMETLNKMTLIEGVETKEQLDIINNLNSDFVQGFFFARPMSIPALISFLSDYNDK